MDDHISSPRRGAFRRVKKQTSTRFGTRALAGCRSRLHERRKTEARRASPPGYIAGAGVATPRRVARPRITVRTAPTNRCTSLFSVTYPTLISSFASLLGSLRDIPFPVWLERPRVNPLAAPSSFSTGLLVYLRLTPFANRCLTIYATASHYRRDVYRCIEDRSRSRGSNLNPEAKSRYTLRNYKLVEFLYYGCFIFRGNRSYGPAAVQRRGGEFFFELTKKKKGFIEQRSIKKNLSKLLNSLGYLTFTR